jgi:hypothetical protein
MKPLVCIVYDVDSATPSCQGASVPSTQNEFHLPNSHESNVS